MTRWILARHGQSVANAAPFFSGHMDVPLTEQGHDEARRLGEALRRHRIERVFSSDLVRAVDTARGAMHGRSYAIRTHEGLRERHLGEWTGIRMEDAVALGVPELLGTLEGRPPGGESLRDVAMRVLGVLDALDQGVPTLVVAHGGVLRAVLGLLDAAPAVRVQRTWVPNAAPYVRELPPGTWGELRRALAAAPYGGTP